jgi:YggT family protein
VNVLLASLDATIGVARIVFLVLACVVTVVCITDWAVRTRRVSPFSGLARFFRSSIDPLFAPVERSVVRRGGIPSNVPWWVLAAVVLGGIGVIWLLGVLREQVTVLAYAAASGTRGIIRLVIGWAFGLLQIALLLRVVASWFRTSPSRWWLRWSIVLTEPILRPLRGLIPPVAGAIDVTPMVAYLLLWLLERLILGGL